MHEIICYIKTEIFTFMPNSSIFMRYISYNSMTKIAKSYTFNGDLVSAIGILATKLKQSKSQLLENTLRNDPEIQIVLKQIHSMEPMPDYTPETKKEIIA